MYLNFTVDQAFQFCISCGVLVPEQQEVTPEALQKELAKRLAGSQPQISTTDETLKKIGLPGGVNYPHTATDSPGESFPTEAPP